MNVRTTSIALATLTLSFGLTACGGGQSVSDACGVAEKEVQSAMGDLSSLSATDPDKAAGTIEKIGDALDKTEDKVDNTEVKTTIGKLSDAFDDMEDGFDDLKEAGTDADKLQSASTTLTDASSEVQKQGKKLDELCS